MRVLVVDNYDSFTFNLVQYLGVLGADVTVVRNDEMSVAEAGALNPDRLVIGPGPGTPGDTGNSLAYLRELSDRVPTLGVCLGHQAIGHVFGGRVASAPQPRHGKTSTITHDGEGVFAGLPASFEATRYHSLAIVDAGPELEVTATSADGVIQGVRHRSRPVEGVQFHPESIMTAPGLDMLRNFLEHTAR
jgi:anthranilate synthase/aminodeoxychorismate synthase-like glutamine amidotransferase